MTRRRPVRPILKVVVALICIGVIGAVVLTLTSRKPIPKETLQAQEQAMGRVCAATAVPGAAIYGGRRPHPIVLLSSSGQIHQWSAWVPAKWQPLEMNSTQLVACVGEEQREQMQVCDYAGGLPVARYWYGVSVNLFAAHTGELLTTLPVHGSAAAACPKVAPQLLMRLEGSHVTLSDVEAYLTSYVESRRQTTWRPLGGAVQSVAWSPDSRTLAYGSQDGAVRLRDASSGEVIRTLGEDWHLPPALRVAWSPDQATLAARYDGGLTLLWDVRGDEQVIELAEKAEALRNWQTQREMATLTWSPDGATLATGNPDGTVTLWDAGKGEAARTLKVDSHPISGLTWSPGGETLAIAANDTVSLWRVAASERLLAFKWEDGWVHNLAFSPDGTMLAAGSALGPRGSAGIILWNAKTGEWLRTLGAGDDDVLAVAWSPDGKTVAAGREFGFIGVWLVNTTGEVTLYEKELAGDVLSVAFNSDGTVLASGSDEGVITLWAVEPIESFALPFPDWVGWVIVLGGYALIALVYFGSAIWVAADAGKQGRSGCWWLLLVLLTFPLGLIIYLLIRRSRPRTQPATKQVSPGLSGLAESTTEPECNEAGQVTRLTGGAGRTSEPSSAESEAGRIKCPSCAYENVPTRLTCKVCGTQLKAPLS